MTRMGEREIGAVSRRLLDNPGELDICITYIFVSCTCNMLEICCFIILAGNSDEDDGIVPDDPMQNTDNTSNLNCDSGR